MSSVVRSEEEAQPVFETSRHAVIAAVAVLAGVLLWIFWEFFHGQWRWAVEHPADWGHTVVIPAIAFYFVYLQREKLLAKPFRTAWTGLVPTVLGVAWYVFCAIGPPTLHHHNVMAFGVALTIFGLVLLFCGYRAMLWLWFPLCYLFLFGQAISERFMTLITFPLQDLAAGGSYFTFVLMGLDVERAGNTLTILHDGEEIPLNIAEACSGMRMLMAMLALGVAMAFIGLPRIWQRVVLVVLAVPTAIAVNIMRVVTLGLLAMIDVDFAAGDFHTAVGLVWLVPAFLIYLGLMWVVSRIVVEADTGAETQPSTPMQVKGSDEV